MPPSPNGTPAFVAVNYISCEPGYRERFEELFATRAKAIDTLPGFRNMHVLRPGEPGGQYLIVSYWDSEQHFKDWTRSPQFLEGHKRGFADLAEAKARGEKAPMHSDFKTYQIISE